MQRILFILAVSVTLLLRKDKAITRGVTCRGGPAYSSPPVE